MTSHLYNTFVIRIKGMLTGALRGHIQHVATQQEEYFESYDKMNRFISEHLNPPGNGPPIAGQRSPDVSDLRENDKGGEQRIK